MKNKIYLTVVAIAMFCSFCQAQTQGYTLGYYKGTPLHLGSGFLLSNPWESELPFLKPFTKDSENYSGNTNFLFTIVTNESSLQEATNTQGYLSISGIGYSVGASYGVSSSSFYSSSSVTLALNATTDYGSLYISSFPVLDSAAEADVMAQNWTAFTNSFGDNYVCQVERGVSITVFLTISNLSQSQQSSLSTAFSGSVTGLGSAGASFNSNIQSASSSGNLSIQIASNGASFVGLSAIIKAASANTNAIDSIQNALASYMTQFTLANANVTQFNYTPISKIVANLVSDSLISYKVNDLTALYDHYYDINEQDSLLHNILTGNSSFSNFYKDFHNAGDAAEATRLANQFQFAADSLYDAFQACKANPCSSIYTCCNNPAFNFNPAFFNKFLLLPFSNCTYADWSEQYANKTFTFTSNATNQYGTGASFFDCTSTDSNFAGNNVNVSVNGIIWNPGSNQCGISGSYCPTLGLGIQTLNGSPGTLWSINNCGNVSGNAYPSMSLSNTIGADGNITIQFNFNGMQQCAPGYLNLLQGATLAISLPNLTPAIDAIITPGQATICQDDSIPLTANTCNGCSYLWSTGETTQSIYVKDSANYTVNVSNSSSSTTSYWSTITVNHPPVIPVITTENGSTTICQGSSITANSAGCDGCTYTWLPGGQTGSSINITAGGTYSVTTSNGCSLGATSQPITIAIDQPPIPSFTISGHYLKANNITGATYQWFLNNNPIKGATSSIYIFDSTGYYSVGITDSYGCSALSTLDTLLNITSGINELSSLSQQINIYPNPTNGKLFISTSLFQNETVIVSVVNVLGQVGLSPTPLQLKGDDASVDISTLPAGIYFLQMKTGRGNIMKKFVKE